MIQPRLPVIPSEARNLKSITTRPVSQCHVYVMTNSGKQRENSHGRLYLRTDTLDSSTPLRYAQNDSDAVAFSSLESGSIVKCLPLSARRGEIQRGGVLSHCLPTRPIELDNNTTKCHKMSQNATNSRIFARVPQRRRTSRPPAPRALIQPVLTPKNAWSIMAPCPQYHSPCQRDSIAE